VKESLKVLAPFMEIGEARVTSIHPGVGEATVEEMVTGARVVPAVRSSN
jgi:hypothetical protein